MSTAVAEHSFAEVRILSMQPQQGGERRVCLKLQSSLGGETTIVEIYTLDQLLEELAPASLVIAQRYHGALAALALGKEVEIVPQREGDKLSTLKKAARDITAGEQALKEALLH